MKYQEIIMCEDCGEILGYCRYYRLEQRCRDCNAKAPKETSEEG